MNVHRFFQDKHGHYVLWQNPNLPLAGWAFARLVSIVTSGRVEHGTALLSQAFLFTWAFLEITKGDSYFRRTLGALVMIALLIGFFS